MTDFYTAVGDDGTTGLLNEGRVPKFHHIPETIGTIDEANSALGLARSISLDEADKGIILTVQRDLYHLMAEISASPDHAARFRKIDAGRVAWLEAQIEALASRVENPNEFIVPGDTFPAAALDLARTIVRRAERQVASLTQQGVIVNLELLRYLNRLSSLCFVLELSENQVSGRNVPTLARDIS